MKRCPECGFELKNIPNYDCWYCSKCEVGWWGNISIEPATKKEVEALIKKSTKIINEPLSPVRCSCSPNNSIICFSSEKELEIMCTHKQKTRFIVIGDGKLVQSNSNP